MVGNLPERVAWRAQYPFTSQALYLSSGARMHYVDEGQGEPVVCLHGNPTWSFYYRRLVQEFSPRNRVVVPDHIGCGLSEKPQQYDYCLQTHIDNFSELVQALNLEPFTLVVHDWGGAIGFGYAVQHPERVKRILCLNTAAYRSQHMHFTVFLARFPWLGEFLVRALNAFVLGALQIGVKKNRLDAVARSGYLYPYNCWNNRVAVARFVQDIPMRPDDPSYAVLQSIEERLHVLADKPISFVWGAKDCVFDEHFLRDWQGIYPEAHFLRLADVGHLVMEDAFEEVREQLNLLLEK